jgi:fructose-1,6-bisphosphatase/inositol monophosphatase family enzyme
MRPEDLRDRLIDLHERIRKRVAAAQDGGALRHEGEATADAARIAAEGAADITFGIDFEAERDIGAFAEELARHVPLRVLSEGFGDQLFAPRGVAPKYRLVIDPIDGTRNLMFDLRSGFVLTAFAHERGDATRLSDVFVAVQSELPPTDRKSAVVLSAIRGAGSEQRRRDVATGALGPARPIAASTDERLDNGFFVFFKFNREERTAIAAIEERFLELLVTTHPVDGRLLFDDQYISSAGQLYLLLTRRYRFLADLRGVVGDRLGIANQTSKPYDLCCALIATEAGVQLTDWRGAPFDLPLDLTARVSLAGYANASVRRALEPLLMQAIDERLPAARGAGT